ncbi:MAG: MerR family transcriptional regulator [Planctomycetota bacterium]
MAELLTIGGLAKAADVPVSTVRYYEREGIIRPARRSASNYRLYSKEDVERLRFIRAAQATGFALDDVRELLRPAACRKVQELIEHRLDVVEGRMRELRHVRRVLRRSLDECREHERTGRCRVVDDLSARARRPRG